jgi:hypothetical protein
MSDAAAAPSPARAAGVTPAKLAIFALAASIPLDVMPSGEVGQSITALVGVAATGVVVMTALARGRVRAVTTGHLALLGYLGWNVLSYFWSLDRDQTCTRMTTVAQLVVMLWALMFPQLRKIDRLDER